MKTSRRFALLSLLLIAMFVFVPVVSAHPLGNFTINHFAALHVRQEKAWIDYVLDMAEIPAYAEISNLDRNQNGKPDADELSGYPERQCQGILQQLSFTHNQSPAPLSLTSSAVSFPPGAGGLSTLRLSCAFQNASLSLKNDDQLVLLDNSYSDRIGWREMVVDAEGVQLSGQFATQSISRELTAYPQDLLSSPLDVRQVSFQVGAAASDPAEAVKSAARASSAYSLGAQSDRFTQLITLQELTPAGILAALLIAVVWGGLHALTPGHGKTIVGAYLVGSRGTAVHALYLGLMTTLTHTAGVFLLGFATYFASRYLLPEKIFPWISLLSGMLVVGIGVALCASRLRHSRAWTALTRRLSKSHAPQLEIVSVSQSSFPVRMPGLANRAYTSVLVGADLRVRPVKKGDTQVAPYPEHAPHPHSHLIFTHGHNGAAQPHTHAPVEADLRVRPAQKGDTQVAPYPEHAPHTHSHGLGEHSHLPPEALPSKVTWRSLLALGISGGLLPCPSALVVLLGAIALDRIGFGILLVLAFSLGLAGVLTGIGLALVYARRFFERLPVRSRWIELIPVGSALFITILGAGIILQALAQMGWIIL